MAEALKIFLSLFIFGNVRELLAETNLPYIKQCKSDVKDLTGCFISSIHHIRPYLARGIPDIEMPSTEPFRMDELSLSLTTGPNGYRVTLRDIDVFGASNYTVSSLKLAEGKKPFETRIIIPKMRITSKYSSSGVLIILPASGNGTFHAALGDVSTVCKGFVSKQTRNGEDYLHIDSMELDLEVKNVRMLVKKVFNNNRILTEATNLFLKENGHEVLKAMTPQLRKKLSAVFMQIGNQIFKHVPVSSMYLKL